MKILEMLLDALLFHRGKESPEVVISYLTDMYFLVEINVWDHNLDKSHTLVAIKDVNLEKCLFNAAAKWLEVESLLGKTNPIVQLKAYLGHDVKTQV